MFQSSRPIFTLNSNLTKKSGGNVDDFNGYVPDGYLLDIKVPTILEVFGMSSDNESYHIQRKIKIAHFSGLNPKFNFWYWDAFKDDNIPKIPDTCDNKIIE